MDCLFCKIIEGEIPSQCLYEDDKVYVFKDIEPQAPVHFLVIPKKHIDSLDAMEDEDVELIGYVFKKIRTQYRRRRRPVGKTHALPRIRRTEPPMAAGLNH